MLPENLNLMFTLLIIFIAEIVNDFVIQLYRSNLKVTCLEFFSEMSIIMESIDYLINSLNFD